MPYIDAKRREVFDHNIDEIVKKLDVDFPPGELNYCLSQIVWRLWQRAPYYSIGNILVGVLECAKQEFYRRMLAPYEDKKRIANGDIV